MMSRWALLPLVALISGCAMYPEVGQEEVLKQLTIEVRLASPMEPDYHYFFALDLDNGAEPDDGPVPILNGPPWGNGWGAISGTENREEPSYYIEWHLGSPVQFIMGREQGRPYRWETAEGGRVMEVTVDIGQVEKVIGRSLSKADLNVIATNVVVQNPAYEGDKWTDGLGEVGTSYLRFSLHTDFDFYNDAALEREEEGDVLDRGGRVVADETAGPLDIVDWHIRARIGK